MARETKAEREERYQREREELAAARAVNYFPNLMDLLERSSNLGWKLSVKDGNFYVSTPYYGRF